MITPTISLYLASKSPRRAQLLSQMGVTFDLLLPGADENAEALEEPQKNENPSVYVERVTRAKLAAAVVRFYRLQPTQQLAVKPILTSDTTVALGGKILGKPSNDQDARQMLQLLSGRTHRVITAVGLAKGSNHQRQTIVLQTSRVTFSRISNSWIDNYVASGEPFDKAGGYGIQGSIAMWVRKIDGSYSGIMGLPLYETARLLGLQQ